MTEPLSRHTRTKTEDFDKIVFSKVEGLALTMSFQTLREFMWLHDKGVIADMDISNLQRRILSHKKSYDDTPNLYRQKELQKEQNILKKTPRYYAINTTPPISITPLSDYIFVQPLPQRNRIKFGIGASINLNKVPHINYPLNGQEQNFQLRSTLIQVARPDQIAYDLQAYSAQTLDERPKDIITIFMRHMYEFANKPETRRLLNTGLAEQKIAMTKVTNIKNPLTRQIVAIKSSVPFLF